VDIDEGYRYDQRSTRTSGENVITHQGIAATKMFRLVHDCLRSAGDLAYRSMLLTEIL